MAGEHVPEVKVCEGREALSLAAAGLFASEARRAAESGASFNVLLSGGETPRRCYEMLASEPLAAAIPWRAVHLFWGDERHVPHDDPRSNYGMARDALLRHVPLIGAQIHPVPYEKTARESALSYERELREHFAGAPCRFQLALLGLGEDGHTASLFPGTPALDERERWVCEVHPPAQEMDRITLTAPVLNASSVIVFLVSGSKKAQVLQQVLENRRDGQRLPARLIRPDNGRLIWLADRDAARLLSERS